MNTAKFPIELTKKYKVTLGDYANTIVLTNSLTKIENGVEKPKFDNNAKVGEIVRKP